MSKGAICANHIHLAIRTHRDHARVMWDNFTDSIRERLRAMSATDSLARSRVEGRLRFPRQISPTHPVISARPYNVLLNTPDDVWPRIRYIESNPAKDGLSPQHWPFVTSYNNWPFHKQKRSR